MSGVRQKRLWSTGTALVGGPVDTTRSFEEELLQFFARQGRRVPGPVFLVAAVIAAMAAQSEEVEPVWPVAWLALVILVLALRSIVLGRLPDLPALPVRRRLNIVVVLAAVSGITHSLSVGFFPFLSDFERALQSMFLIGLCAGAVSTTAGYTPAFLAYILPTLGSLAVRWGFSDPTTRSWLESAAAVLFVFLGLVLTALARDAFRLFRESFDIRLQQVELNERLRNALEEAESASRAKTRFLAAASHDLRQPIHGLRLFTAVLSMRALDERSRAVVKDMDGALEVLSSELDSLLDISKHDAGLVRAAKQATELRPVLERVCQTFAAEALAKGLELVMSCPHGLHANTDARLLERVLRNLVQNAIKYTAAGSVALRASASADAIEIAIADTGSGIPESEHGRVFEEFYQLANPERDHTKGLGLGLAIVKRLADLLDIHIELISAPGAGTTFVLTLERVDVPGEAAPQQTPQPAVSLEGLRVLVVDDEAPVRAATQELLEALGCRVSAATGTEQAVTAARTDRPDIVLADFRLRGGDNGIGVVIAIRALYPGLPALIVSGDTAPERLREADAAQLTLLHKPLSGEALKTAIAATVRRVEEVSV